MLKCFCNHLINIYATKTEDNNFIILSHKGEYLLCDAVPVSPPSPDKVAELVNTNCR